jgi:hypothetical protein
MVAWSKPGDTVKIRQQYYTVVEVQSDNTLLRPVLLRQGRKLYTASQGVNGDFSRPAKVEGWSYPA